MALKSTSCMGQTALKTARPIEDVQHDGLSFFLLQLFATAEKNSLS